MAPRLELAQKGCVTLKGARLASKMGQIPSPTMSPDNTAMPQPKRARRATRLRRGAWRRG